MNESLSTKNRFSYQKQSDQGRLYNQKSEDKQGFDEAGRRLQGCRTEEADTGILVGQNVHRFLRTFGSRKRYVAGRRSPWWLQTVNGLTSINHETSHSTEDIVTNIMRVYD